MISEGKLNFNCCESTLKKVNAEKPLPGFDKNIMRIASGFGGGIGSWGSICGAVSGAAMALGLVYGANGDEDVDTFKAKREELRLKTREFLGEFQKEFGNVNCQDLLGVNRHTEEGRRRYSELTGTRVFRCNEYVEWASRWIADYL
jgi:C_GCAxxG_C_C family probable redox protein